MEVHIAFNSLPIMLGNADFLISLSAANEDRGSFLLGSACIACAAALDEALFSTLHQFGNWYSSTYSVPFEKTPASALLGGSFRQRMLRTPEIVSLGAFRINQASRTVRALNDLITLRNTLMHLEPDTMSIAEGADPAIWRVDPDHVAVLIDTRRLEMPWQNITSDMAIAARQAVQDYYDKTLSLPRTANDLLLPAA